jgi:DNA-binding PadR family transcriptional regulator
MNGMPKEKSGSYPHVKDLGKLREKIIFHLSQNPNLNAQALQKALDYPSSQYPNILKALKKLEKFGLVKSKSGKSKKNVPIRLYRCTDNGILYALARNPRADALKTIAAYEHLDPLAISFRALYDIMGPELFFRFVRDVDEFMPMIQKDGIDNVEPYIVMKMTMHMNHMDLDTKTRIIKQLMEQFPHTKQRLRDWVDSINKLL